MENFVYIVMCQHILDKSSEWEIQRVFKSCILANDYATSAKNRNHNSKFKVVKEIIED